jgi:Hydrazine synthase alpha subunit middle domain
VNDRDLRFFNKWMRAHAPAVLCALSVGTLLSGCSLGKTGDSTAFCPVVEEGAVAFVKRPLQFDENNPNTLIADDLREPQAFRPGARLFIKANVLPSSEAVDITSSVFSDPSFLNDEGQLLYDVKDLAVSFDATKLAFSMRAPEIEGADDEDQPKWNIWVYDFETCSLSRAIESDATAESGHDITPAFLADDRIVYSSTRQQVGKAILLDEGKPQYSALDEELDFEAFNLHAMEVNGQDIEQITFNQSHDLNPVPVASGRVVFSRWDNAGQTRNNGMNLYEVNPDGTGLNYLYGRHSHDSGEVGTTVQYARPIESDDGNIIVELREFESPTLSAVPTKIDVFGHIESDQRTDGTIGEGQAALISDIDTTGELSLNGNYGSVFPLYDNTGRLLASWSVCRVRQALAPDAPIETEANPPEVCTQAKLDDDLNYEAAPPLYGLWIVDGATQLPIVLPEEGQEFTDAVLVSSRSRPTFIPDLILDADEQLLADEGFGVLHIRSVYDIDGVDTSPAGIVALADPVQTPPANRPLQFLRIEKAASIPPDYVRDIDNSAFGRSRAQLMREILGYVPIEPDGSVKVAVPANVTLSLSLLDGTGQRPNNSERHQNWLSVKPGETLECKGCHTGTSEVPHGRIDAGPEAVNAGATTTGLPFPNTEPALFADAGETMAEVYARINGIRQLSPDVSFTDQWTDDLITPKAASYDFLYADLDTTIPINTPACVSQWTSLCRTIVNYPEHIQPLWNLDRRTFDIDGITVLTDFTCTTCHNNEDAAGDPMIPVEQLDLSNDPSTDEPNHFVSYRNLLFRTVEQEIIGGILQPVLVATGEFERDEEGELILDGAGNPIEIFATVPVQPTMRTAGAKASSDFIDNFAAGGPHAGYLTDTELRLISEWLDIGAQYWNDPFKAPTN